MPCNDFKFVRSKLDEKRLKYWATVRLYYGALIDQYTYSAFIFISAVCMCTNVLKLKNKNNLIFCVRFVTALVLFSFWSRL